MKIALAQMKMTPEMEINYQKEIYQFNRRSGTKGRFIDLISGDTADTILSTV